MSARCDTSAASAPQCPLPFLSFFLHPATLLRSATFLPFGPSPLFSLFSACTPPTPLRLIFITASPSFAFDMPAIFLLSFLLFFPHHAMLSLSSLSAAPSLLFPPLLPPPLPPTTHHLPSTPPSILLCLLPSCSLSLSPHSLAAAAVLPPPFPTSPLSLWCGAAGRERERASWRNRDKERESEAACVRVCVFSLRSVSAVGRWRMEPQPRLSSFSASR